MAAEQSGTGYTVVDLSESVDLVVVVVVVEVLFFDGDDEN
jgi:NADH:ubiquinone oxidoreductase subunit H